MILQNFTTNAVNSDNSFGSRINLTFPFMSIFGRQLDLSPSFFGIRKFDNYEAQQKANSSTNIQHLPLIVLQFRADMPSNGSKDDVVVWQRAVEQYYHQ